MIVAVNSQKRWQHALRVQDARLELHGLYLPLISRWAARRSNRRLHVCPAKKQSDWLHQDKPTSAQSESSATIPSTRYSYRSHKTWRQAHVFGQCGYMNASITTSTGFYNVSRTSADDFIVTKSATMRFCLVTDSQRPGQNDSCIWTIGPPQQDDIAFYTQCLLLAIMTRPRGRTHKPLMI